MPRRPAVGLLCFLLLFLAPCPATAATYVDDMTDLNSNHIKQYSGLAPFYLDARQQAAWARLPDLTMHTFASTAVTKGYAIYRVQGAGSVTVSIYTQTGSYAAALPDNSGRYSLGPAREDTGYLAGQQLVQAKYSPGRDGVYAQAGGELRQAFYNESFYELLPAGDSPGDLVGYGTNVYASADNVAYTQVSLRLVKTVWEPGIRYIYDQYAADLPGGTRYIRVELNDTARRMIQPAEGAAYSVAKQAGTFASLASVAFEGDQLTLGAPPELSSESDPLGESESREDGDWFYWGERRSSSSSRAGGAAGGSGGGATAAAAGGASKAASSKFEGVIVSTPSTAARAASRGQSSSRAEDSAVSESAAPPPPSQPPEREEISQVAYEILPPSQGSGEVSPWVAVYLVAVAGVILFLLLRKRG